MSQNYIAKKANNQSKPTEIHLPEILIDKLANNAVSELRNLLEFHNLLYYVENEQNINLEDTKRKDAIKNLLKQIKIIIK
jgi:hypothetical protein